MRVSGFDKALSNLSKLQQNAQALDGEHTVTLAELFPPSFVSTHTEFPDIQTMADVSGLFESGDEEPRAEQAQQALHSQAWNDFVAQHTEFSDWRAMQRAAIVERTRPQLFKGLK